MPLSTLAQDRDRPDVLFISIDDLNDWVGPLDGHPQTKTPNMDRLAAQGMVFSNAHVPAMICNSSRAAIMTGISPSSSGVYGNGTDWRVTERLRGIPTLPRYFKDNGYRSFGAGKLFHSSTFNPWAYFGYNDTTAWEAYFPSLERQLPDETTPHVRPANGSPLSTNFDWAAISTTDMAMGDGQVVTWSVEKILADGNEPRFNAVGIYRPHLPWYLPQKYFDMHPLDDIILPRILENDLDDVPEAPLQGARRGNMAPMALHDWVIEDESGDRWRQGVQAYLASISFADAMVGQVLDALEQSGRADNTIIVLWSDHGWHLGEKARWRKSTLWRESTRVPLIVVAPGVTQAGSESAETVSLMDLYPTLVELAGLDVPEHVEGVSLLPLLEDPGAPWDRVAVSTNGRGNHAITDNRYRYLRYADGSEELYDLQSDPDEWHNRAGDEQLAAVKAELARRLPTHDEPVDQSANRTNN
jgi:arylsulfatase A-like enzyme